MLKIHARKKRKDVMTFWIAMTIAKKKVFKEGNVSHACTLNSVAASDAFV
jgi:hypothetical protein